MKKEDIITYLIINIPVFLFVIIASIFTFLSFYFKNLWLLFGTWWGLSGAIMLTIDFLNKKRKKFLRLLIIFQKGKEVKKIKEDLKQTICGLSLLLAIKYRLKKPIKNII